MNHLLKRIKELNSDLIIRKATPADALGFTSLMNKRYARKNNKNYFFWRFFFCPVPSILYVITTKDDVIIGAYGMNILTLSDGKKCGLVVDLIISDKYTKRGLFILLEDKINTFARINNCTYLLCLPNALGMQAHTEIEGWQLVRNIPLLTFKPGQMKLMQFPQTIGNLNKRILAFKYTKQLLHWRFAESPEYKYLQIKFGKSQSYIKIFSDTMKKISFGDIVYYSSSSKSEFRTLINKSVQKLQALNAQKIITWCSASSTLYPIFLSLGFTPEDQPRYVCVKPILPNTKNPLTLNWQILPADSEVF